MGTCVSLNCVIQLAALGLSSFWLITLTNLLEGVKLLYQEMLFPLSDAFQASFHFLFSFS